MNVTRIRLPKALLIGVPVSLLVLIATSILLTLIVRYVPLSPTAKIYSYLALNHDNPEVYGTHYYQTLMPQAEYLDAFICTPIAIFVSGLAFGIYVKRSRIAGLGALGLGALLGAVFSILVNLVTWILIAAITYLVGSGAPSIASFNLSGKVLGQALIEISLCAIGGAIGSWLTSRGTLPPSDAESGRPRRRLPQPKAA